VTTVVVSPYTPALGSGRALRTYTLLRALAELGDVELVFARFGAAEPDAAHRAIRRLTLHPVAPSRGPARARTFAAALARGTPLGLARGVSPELCAEAERRAVGPRAARLVADGPIAAAALLPLAGRIPLTYNAHNLESAFRHSLDGARLGGRRRLARFERRLLRRAHESWMVSRGDLGGARALAPGARLRLVPNVVDVAAITPVDPARRVGPRALFVADFRYPPNRRGLDFLAHEVMPRVWRRLPAAELDVVGRGLDRPPADTRVHALGFVEDLDTAYGRAACAVVPLLQGGGSPLKFVEALAYGLPVVATPRAAAGLEVRAGEHYVAGPADADGFAAALAGALGGDATGIGAAGRALAEREYSVAALVEHLRR
jgi:glycosyltransferase involved in cell wall biosynthesis